MFQQVVRNTTKGVVRAEIGYDPLQRQGTAPAGYPGTQTERPVSLSLLFVLLFEYSYYAERTVPMDFF